MPVTYTPLRYPGGKNALAGFLREVIRANELSFPNYVEPYCGGAGAALNLLFSETVSDIYLNDINSAVYAFWYLCLNEPDALCRKVERVPVTVREWNRQRSILLKKNPKRLLDLAFATLFLNRVNRSGILSGGLIGGRRQTGRWKMNARFNRKALIDKIRLIARYKTRIHVSNLDALTFLRQHVHRLSPQTFVYLDPPYVEKGHSLYENHYSIDDHRQIAGHLRTQLKHPWLISYDACAVIRRLYAGLFRLEYRINYSAHAHGTGREIIVFGPNMKVPAYRTPLDAPRSSVLTHLVR